MPLTHIQLRAKEKEAARARPAAKKPALARRLAGEGVQAPKLTGPTEKAPTARGAPTTRAPLARALTPITGRPDWQAEAWARREEMAEERRVEAKGLYDRLLPLDEEGRSITLDAARRYKPDVVKAMEREGYISPDGALAEPEEVNKPMTRDTHVEDGWLYEDVLYEDGTSTHEIIGRAEEVEAKGATVTEIINAQKLGIDIEQHEERFYRDALKIAGDCPRIGIDMVVEDGEERPVEQEDVDAWKTNMNNTIKSLREAAGVVPGAEVPVSMEDVKSMYEGRPDLISDVQRQLGLAVTGVWDDPLEEALRTYGGVE